MVAAVVGNWVDPHAVEFFEKVLLEDPANAVCCDHPCDGAQWASVSHGIYISLRASGAHRSLGVKTSFVLSTTMDSWKPEQLRMMELGGNRRFQEFLRTHGVNEDLPIRHKYSTRAAEWYRKNLRALVDGTTPPEPLPEGTGHLPVDGADTATHQLLDHIFSDAATVAMTAGGVPIRSSSSFAAKLCGRCCGKKVPQTVRPPFGAVVKPDKPLALPTLLRVACGDTTANKLRSMSTGCMKGFGPDMCSHDGDDVRLLVSDASLQQLEIVAV